MGRWDEGTLAVLLGMARPVARLGATSVAGSPPGDGSLEWVDAVFSTPETETSFGGGVTRVIMDLHCNQGG
jgi:hypothetical protein